MTTPKCFIVFTVVTTNGKEHVHKYPMFGETIDELRPQMDRIFAETLWQISSNAPPILLQNDTVYYRSEHVVQVRLSPELSGLDDITTLDVTEQVRNHLGFLRDR